MLSIGEFSRVTQLSVKALRLYHERGILIPSKIDRGSKYRYYGRGDVERAAMIRQMKDMGFSLNEIAEIVRECTDDRQMVSFVQKKMEAVNKTISQYQTMKESLALFLERANEEKPEITGDIAEEEIPDQLVCGIRFKGKYHEIGHYYRKLSRLCARYGEGKPFTLYYDGEYKEEDADIEATFPVRKKVSIEGIGCRVLTGGKAVTLIHRGPFEELGASYLKLYRYCRVNDLKTALPTREQYLKGPGMIFKGNPKKYITKLIMLLEE